MPGRLRTLVAAGLCLTGCTPLALDATPLTTRQPGPTATPSATVPAKPASGNPSASAEPSAEPSVTATPTLEPRALEPLELEVTGCPGGVVVDWTPAGHADFHHYVALRSIEPEIETAYPPIAPAVDWGDSYSTDRFVTSAVDGTLIPSDTTLYYRVMAYDAQNRPLAASPVRDTHLSEVESLGPLTLGPDGETGATRVDWRMFGGLDRCFTAYQVMIGPAGSTPTSVLTVVSDQGTSELATSGLHPGTQYALQVNAIRTTTLGSLLVAQSDVGAYTAP